MFSFLCFQKRNIGVQNVKTMYIPVRFICLLFSFFVCVTVLQETRVVAAERPRHSTTHTKSRL